MYSALSQTSFDYGAPVRMYFTNHRDLYRIHVADMVVRIMFPSDKYYSNFVSDVRSFVKSKIIDTGGDSPMMKEFGEPIVVV
jgi:hypothetical protein